MAIGEHLKGVRGIRVSDATWRAERRCKGKFRVVGCVGREEGGDRGLSLVRKDDG